MSAVADIAALVAVFRSLGAIGISVSSTATDYALVIVTMQTEPELRELVRQLDASEPTERSTSDGKLSWLHAEARVGTSDIVLQKFLDVITAAA